MDLSQSIRVQYTSNDRDLNDVNGFLGTVGSGIGVSEAMLSSGKEVECHFE